MDDDVVTTAELLDAWREATRAAELAQRLAKVARETVARADARAIAADELVAMAQKAVTAAEDAAKTAREAAAEAVEFAKAAREGQEADNAAVALSGQVESEARDAYHHREAEARKAHGDGSR